MSQPRDVSIRVFMTQPITEQLEGAWWDWFCNDSQLKNRGKKLIACLTSLLPSDKIDQDKTYTFFKNNCPLDGNLYDDFRICDIATGDVIYTIIPASGFSAKRGKAEVYGRENKFEAPLAQGTWADVLQFFGH